MKTKADRMWDEFGANLLARLSPQDRQPAPGQAQQPAAVPQAVPLAPPAAANGHAVLPAQDLAPPPAPAGLFRRLFGRRDHAARGPLADICIELRRHDETIVVRWPAAHGEQCAAWLRDYLRPGT
ncbi:conserved hypothetical protein [Cupriavidus taiwanensis]|uniref:Uncharacterized protein n=1 Tax=Cupriavidus taiwanensis TaxID=164546 RepID=A0A375C475_9BURK|nr:conserved hypothetical protein [Cupriavidus taiwanensis]